MRAPVTRSGAETADGVVMGTAGYMSPEQVRGEPVDARSDIFSLGAILFEMLSGRAGIHPRERRRHDGGDPEGRFARSRNGLPLRRSSGSSCGASRNRASRGFSPHAIWRSPWNVCPEQRRAPHRDPMQRFVLPWLRQPAVAMGVAGRTRARARAHAVGAVAKSACRRPDRSQRAAGHRRPPSPIPSARRSGRR